MSDLNIALGSKFGHDPLVSFHVRLENAEGSIEDLLARTVGVASNSKIIELEKKLHVSREQIRELKDAIESKIEYEELRNLRYDLTNATIDIDELTVDMQAKADLSFVANITTHIEMKVSNLKGEVAIAVAHLEQRAGDLEGAVHDLDFRATALEENVFELHKMVAKKAEDGRVNTMGATLRALGNEVWNLQVETETKASNADLQEVFANLTGADNILNNRVTNAEVNITALVKQVGNGAIKNNTGADSNLFAVVGATKDTGMRMEICGLSVNVTLLQDKLAHDEEMIRQLQINQTEHEWEIAALKSSKLQLEARLVALESRATLDEKLIADFQPYIVMIKELVGCIDHTSNHLAMRSCYKHL